jgi:hypothetical protein
VVDASASASTQIDVSDYEPISDPKNVARYVADYFKDIPIMAHIASCESHNRQVTSSGNVIRGEVNHYDVGVMQINELYHADEAAALGDHIYTIEGNVAYARHLYEREGSKPWSSSEKCWGKYDTGTEVAINK